jgi:hypothetical protein
MNINSDSVDIGPGTGGSGMGLRLGGQPEGGRVCERDMLGLWGNASIVRHQLNHSLMME